MLRPSYNSLLAEVHRLQTENADLLAENAALKGRVAELEAALQAALRKAKRQAAPFSHGEPASHPRRPGRKPGGLYGRKAHRPPPSAQQIDEHYDVPLPHDCPHCGGGKLQETHVVTQFQTDIPRRPIYRQFDVHCGVCGHCGRAVHGRHELQTSDAVGAAASQLGPAVHAAMAVLNKELGLSHGKVKRCLERLFGITISRGASAHSVLRTGRKCTPAYQEIRARIRDSPYVVPDETGWRVGGHRAWLHALVGTDATCYEIDPQRGAAVAKRLLGPAWSGVMIHDGWSPYDRFQRARHQQCLAHLRRRCQRILLTARRGAVRFPRQILELIDAAFAIREAHRAGQLDEDQVALQGLALACCLEELTDGHFSDAPNRRLAKHLKKHIWQWFWFLIEPGIDATNWRAEQAIRPAVVNRKVWGGNRTWPGARAQATIASVLRTCEQRGRDGFLWLMRALCTPHPVPLPSPPR
jgi:transposase